MRPRLRLGAALLLLLPGVARADPPVFAPGGAASEVGAAAALPSAPAGAGLLPSATSPGMASVPPRPGTDPAGMAFGAFQRGFFATALAEATARLADDPKDGAAMALVGEIYDQGLGVREDAVEAARWFKLASDNGDPGGSFAYGLALLRGTGVAEDAAAAVPYLEKAAAQGHPGALYNLGVVALKPAGADGPDYGEAAGYFERAAALGDADAQYALGNLLKAGDGVPRDPARAAALLKAAADQRDVAAELDYAIALFNGEGVPKDEAGAALLFRRAAYAGNPVAANRLARLYAAGRGLPKDDVQAVRWHLVARAAGLKDPWLDSVLAALGPAERERLRAELDRGVN